MRARLVAGSLLAALLALTPAAAFAAPVSGNFLFLVPLDVRSTGLGGAKMTVVCSVFPPGYPLSIGGGVARGQTIIQLDGRGQYTGTARISVNSTVLVGAYVCAITDATDTEGTGLALPPNVAGRNVSGPLSR